MKRSRFSEEQIAYALRLAESGTPVVDVCRQFGVSEATYYTWKKKFGDASTVPECMRARCRARFPARAISCMSGQACTPAAKKPLKSVFPRRCKGGDLVVVIGDDLQTSRKRASTTVACARYQAISCLQFQSACSQASPPLGRGADGHSVNYYRFRSPARLRPREAWPHSDAMNGAEIARFIECMVRFAGLGLSNHAEALADPFCAARP